MTPMEALNRRDAIYNWCRWRSKQDGEASDPFYGLYGGMAAAIGTSSLVVWEPNIFRGAVRGWQSLPKTSVALSYTPEEEQLWLFGTDISDALFGDEYPPLGIIGALFIEIDKRVPTDQREWVVTPICQREDSGYTFKGGHPFHFRFSENEIAPGAQPFYAAMLFMQQTFVSQERFLLSGSVVRAAAKGSRPPLPKINVVLLRRSESKSRQGVDSESRDWSCQWIVNGHWRKPSPLMKEPRPVYVRPYVKGDPSKELRTPRETVIKVNR